VSAPYKLPKPTDTQAVLQKTALDTLASLGASRETGLSTADAQARLAQIGANEVPERRERALVRFARKFWGLSAWMLELIVFLSLILRKQADLWVALALLLVNAVLSFLQEQHASTAVAALRAQLRVMGRALRDGMWQAVPARALVPGDVVRMRAGDFVPADVQILDGVVGIDQSALTGESREIRKATDDAVYSGSMVREGEATGVVVATGVRTFFGRTAQLVESARPKLHVEEVVTRVVKWLFLIVGALVSVAVVASLVEGLSFLEILPLSLVLLMSAVPVALPVMFTVSMAVGSVELARRGVLITRLSAAEDAANMDILCADKTGTLTANRLSITGALPEMGFIEDDVLRHGALASNEANQDPIDLAFLQAARERKLLYGTERTLSFVPFSPQTRRTEALVEIQGRTVRVMKGAVETLAEVAGLDAKARTALEERANNEAQKGFRILAVACAESNEPFRLVGVALLYDAPRPDSRRLIDELRALGVEVKMLTGDALPVARVVARELDLGEIVRAPDLQAARKESEARAAELARSSSGFAEVFPEHKFLVVKSLQAAGHVVGMTGDGVNDAPALRQAEVGIAVTGATDVAKGAASVVLTTEGLASIIDLVKNGRAIYQRVLTWIINKVSRTILKAGYVVIAFLVTGRFVISALGMVLLVFMTDFVKIALSTDRVRPSQKPESWNIGPLIEVAVVLGLLMLVETLGLLAIGWHGFDLGSRDGQLKTFAFQTLLFFALFSLLSIRERRAFWHSRPSLLLAIALGADACAGMLIGVYGLAELKPLPLSQTMLIFASALVCSLGVNDFVKVALIARYASRPKMKT
jgi:plasma-membrane proton-efflux P-type ATPase